MRDLGTLVAAVVVAGVVAACGSSSQSDRDGDRRAKRAVTEPRSARAVVAALEEAARDKDAPGVCRLLFSTDFLPASVRRHPELGHLELASEEGASLSQYDADQRRCFRQFGQRGEFSAFQDMPEVSIVRIRQINPTQQITAVASATARASTSGESVRIPLVKFRGAWRLLFVTS